jgi:dynein heavy chain
MTNIEDIVLLNDLHTTFMDQLNVLSSQVYFPLITNSQNQEGWPEVISKEITENFHRFLANTYITIGRTIGKTLLPLPPEERGPGIPDPGQVPAGSLEKTTGHPKDKDGVHILENAVVTWTRQIKNVLRQEPEDLLKNDAVYAGKPGSSRNATPGVPGTVIPGPALNPGPGDELQFWISKSDNLNSIHEQLNGDKIRAVLSVLEASKSTYYPAFDRLCREVYHARAEANDNLLYLRPAAKHFSRLLTCEFDQLSSVFGPIMHVALLIWKHSQFYNTPARLVVLIRELCNDLIRKACGYMGGVAIWDATPEESTNKLRQVISSCLAFKEAYFAYKHRSGVETPDNPWRFQSTALFARLDNFLERCHDVLDLMQTLTQFLTLYRVEIGGTKGKTLTSSVQQIFVDFQMSMLVFRQAQYDVMDIDVKIFDQHFYGFRLEVLFDVCVCVCVCVCMYVCKHVCVYVCMFCVCMYACM